MAHDQPEFHGRVLIVDRYREGKPKAHIAAAMDISREMREQVDLPIRDRRRRRVA
jgi:hypothetical protein